MTVVVHTTPPLDDLPASDGESLRILGTLKLAGINPETRTASWSANGESDWLRSALYCDEDGVTALVYVAQSCVRAVNALFSSLGSSFSCSLVLYSYLPRTSSFPSSVPSSLSRSLLPAHPAILAHSAGYCDMRLGGTTPLSSCTWGYQLTNRQSVCYCRREARSELAAVDDCGIRGRQRWS